MPGTTSYNYNILGKRPLGKSTCTWQNNIKLDVAQNRIQRQITVNGTMNAVVRQGI